MAYNLRNRNSLNTQNYVESTGSDDDSYDSSHSDPDYGNQIHDYGASSSGRNTTRTVERRQREQPTNRRTNGERGKQGISSRHRKRKRTKFSETPNVTKRTILSWLINLSIVKENEIVFLIDKRQSNAILGEGKVNKEGILCNCCSHQFTVDEFEYHHYKFVSRKPYAHIFLARSLVSLLDCQLQAWLRPDQVEARKSNNIQHESIAGDASDDVCMICADGGDLLCCGKCPSTFHPNCIFLQNIPQGEWLCPYCVCKFCARGDGYLNKCMQCEKQYHNDCGEKQLDVNSPAPLFCETSCKVIHDGLNSKVGVKNHLEDGFSWTLLRPVELSSSRTESSVDDLYNKVQINSKIAVALQVLNECFSSNVDRLTRINILQSIVYSCGSNLTRINFGGFYTAILEQNDQIICAATIRVHGKGLAEMPYIGTRLEYRGQGMAKTLEKCVESVLFYLKIEKLVIPSVHQLVDMWVNKYFFKRTEEYWLKKKLCQYNTVMFPVTIVKLLKDLTLLPDINEDAPETT